MIAYRTRYIPFQNKYYHNNNNKQHTVRTYLLFSYGISQNQTKKIKYFTVCFVLLVCCASQGLQCFLFFPQCVDSWSTSWTITTPSQRIPIPITTQT